jgi:hypothetical protein
MIARNLVFGQEAQGSRTRRRDSQFHTLTARSRNDESGITRNQETLEPRNPEKIFWRKSPEKRDLFFGGGKQESRKAGKPENPVLRWVTKRTFDAAGKMMAIFFSPPGGRIFVKTRFPAFPLSGFCRRKNGFPNRPNITWFDQQGLISLTARHIL